MSTKDKIEKIACELEYLADTTQILSNATYSDTVTREDLSNGIKGISSYCHMLSHEAWEVFDEEDKGMAKRNTLSTAS